MSMADFDASIRRNKNELIAFDSFVSTSLSEDVAKEFAKRKRSPTDESILYHMEIDADKIGRPFADISRRSQFGMEGEILFSMGTVFRVADVAAAKNSENLWIVRLVSADVDDTQLKKEGEKTQRMLMAFFKDVHAAQKDRGDARQIAASCVNIASMYYRDGDYDNSLKLYIKSRDKLLQFPSPHELTIATYQSNIARTYEALKKPDEALVLYEKALETRRNRCGDMNDPLLINTLHTVGNMYKAAAKFDSALEIFDEALRRQTSADIPDLQIDPSSIAATHIYIAKVLYWDNQYKPALENFRKALHYQHHHLSNKHPALAFLHNNIGAMNYRLRDYKKALHHHAICLSIEEHSLPKDHITFIDTYRSMAESYEKLKMLPEAVHYAVKLVDQCKLHQSQPPDLLQKANELLGRIEKENDLFTS